MSPGAIAVSPVVRFHISPAPERRKGTPETATTQTRFECGHLSQPHDVMVLLRARREENETALNVAAAGIELRGWT